MLCLEPLQCFLMCVCPNENTKKSIHFATAHTSSVTSKADSDMEPDSSIVVTGIEQLSYGFLIIQLTNINLLLVLHLVKGQPEKHLPGKVHSEYLLSDRLVHNEVTCTFEKQRSIKQLTVNVGIIGYGGAVQDVAQCQFRNWQCLSHAVHNDN